MAVSIITPLFNRWDLTSKFIASVVPYLREDDELIIVDNASTDGTFSNLSRWQTDKKLIIRRSMENTGFGEGNNIGADLATKDVLIFISNDVVVSGDFIRPVERFLSENPKYLVGHRLVDWSTGWNDCFDVTEKIGPIHYLQGYFMGMTRFAFHSVGGFDRHIFIDFDDLDLSYRMKNAGYILMGLPDLPVSHIESGQSFSGLSEQRMNYTLRSMKRFMDKYGFKKVK